MLQKIYINNFRNFVNFEFIPSSTNLLVGLNNSGKSNLCSLLRFIGLTSSLPLEIAAKTALGDVWNLANQYTSQSPYIEMAMECAFVCNGIDTKFRYEIRLHAIESREGQQSPLRIVDEKLCASVAGDIKETILLQRPSLAKQTVDKMKTVLEVGASAETTPEYDKRSLLSQAHLSSNASSSSVAFMKYLQSWQYYSFSPEALRFPVAELGMQLLRWDGGNLSGAIYDLHNRYPRLSHNLIGIAKAIEPKLEYFSFVAPDPETVYLFIEDKQGKKFGIRSISDGTLRFLAMAFVILKNRPLPESLNPPPFIIIEEPENGLHVGLLKPLIEMIDHSGKDGQYVFTSHNPYFIDLFDANLDGVHVLKPGLPSSTISRPDHDKIMRLLESMPLGEMYFREMLV
ncbi:MAG: AAA family ATPase [Candidatus Sumerlaeota bacterium]|nr:AAA family ATPase [Candidatus Sumerlaeota bacterium]